MSFVFPVTTPSVAIVGEFGAIPGAAHLLRRPQLRGACARDG